MALRSFVVCALAALVLCAAAAVPAARADDAAGDTGYVPPVAGPVVDGWRPPSSHYGAGNRGIDFAAEPGDAVRASADGTVTFAGRIGSATHVVVLHDDGLRTSYSFLASTTARRGDRVAQGDVVGIAAGAVHFGVRAGDEYLDPTAVLGGGPPKVHLIPADRQRPLTEAQERRGVLAGLAAVGGRLGRVARAGVTAAGWAATTTTSLAGLVAAYGWQVVEVQLLELEAQLRRFENGARAVAHMLNVPGWTTAMQIRWLRVLRDQVDCTPADVDPPPSPGQGHIVVLVAGLGSTGGGGSVADIDTRALGYDDDHVAQFSYNGGQSPGDRHVSGIPVTDYGVEDTWGDLTGAGAALRALLRQIHAAHPGVPVDLIAHSQGGLVVRAALDAADAWAPDLPTIPNVVTIATPHHGSPLGSVAALVGLDPVTGTASQQLVSTASARRLPASAMSVQQMSSGSTFLRDLDDRSLPTGTHLTSIAASGDEVVGAGRSAVEGATNVIVPLDGLLGISPHLDLPGHDLTRREVALALAGHGPTCRPDTDPAGTTDMRLAWIVGATRTSPRLVELLADQLRGLSPQPWGPVESPTAPSGTRPPG